MDAAEFLSPELATKFVVCNTHCPVVLNTPIGDIDFRTITEAQAEELVNGDFYYLQRKATDTKPPGKNKPAVTGDSSDSAAN